MQHQKLTIDVRRNIADIILNAGGRILKHFFDLIERVNDGRVVSSKLAADIRQASDWSFYGSGTWRPAAPRSGTLILERAAERLLLDG